MSLYSIGDTDTRGSATPVNEMNRSMIVSARFAEDLREGLERETERPFYESARKIK
jgi:hypothetical protein